jgi:hypothetical protein
MPYKLKPQYESFTVVDGEFAGRAFDHSMEYETIPPEEKHKFERVNKEIKDSRGRGFKKDQKPPERDEPTLEP